MNKDRLLKLADFLGNVPAASFNIEKWQSSTPTKPEGAKLGDCGFAGCAMGWAAHGKLFDGLTMEEGKWGTSPVYNNYVGFDAAMDLFDISEYEAEGLFDPSGYPMKADKVTPAVVAAAIRKFVETGVVEDHDEDD